MQPPIINDIIKYLLEATAVAVSVHLISNKKFNAYDSLAMIFAITITMMLLDMFSPKTSAGNRQGMGFGLGFSGVGFGGMAGGAVGDNFVNTPMPREMYPIGSTVNPTTEKCSSAQDLLNECKQINVPHSFTEDTDHEVGQHGHTLLSSPIGSNGHIH